MKGKLEKALRELHTPLQQRLDAVVDFLYNAPWADRNAICFAPTTEKATLSPDGCAPKRTELHQIRHDGFQWSQRQLMDSGVGVITINDALGRIQDGVTELVRRSVAMIGQCVSGLIQREYRAAVVSRERLVQDWRWPLEVDCGGAFLQLALSLCPTLPPNEPLVAAWPPDAASANVAKWARKWLTKNATNENVADQMSETLRLTPMIFDLRAGLPYRRMVTPTLALLHQLEQEIKDNQKRKYIAIDACKEHTKLMESWRDLPKSKQVRIPAIERNGRVELILPDTTKKRHIQLSIAFPGEDTLAAQVGSALREWRSWAGLRHWVAFQSLITNNRRLGWVRWTVEAHLEAMGYSKERRRRLELRRDAARMVQLFTEIEIGICDEKGRVRERRPLVLKGSTYERMVDSEWEIEGLELKINPLLYRGVRDPETGEIGKSWWPTPRELPHISHNRYGPAIALGTVLPARWRMELGHSNHPYVDLKGDSLLRAAGLPYSPGNLTATWRSIERNLDELQRRGGLERWQWLGEPDLGTVCRLYAPTWALDRIAHGVPPVENKPAPTALKGAELKAWRLSEKLTQAGAAKRLGVGDRTIGRAEAQPEKPLSKKVREALTRQTSEAGSPTSS